MLPMYSFLLSCMGKLSVVVSFLKLRFVMFLFRPLLRGEEQIFKWVFFVQSILADRCIHRGELRLVSLESLYNVEYGIKKMFLIFVFTGRYRGLNCRENRVNSIDFIHFLRNF